MLFLPMYRWMINPKLHRIGKMLREFSCAVANRLQICLILMLWLVSNPVIRFPGEIDRFWRAWDVNLMRCISCSVKDLMGLMSDAR